MKPMTRKLAVCLLGFGLSATLKLAAQQAQDIPLTVKLQLTATVQGADQGDNGVSDKVLVSTVKVNSQTMFGQSSLILSGGAFSLPGGSQVGSVSTGTQVTGGQTFDTSLKQNSSISSLMTINLDNGNGWNCNLTGVAKETYSLSAQDSNGNQAEKDRLTITVVGDGNVGGSTAVFTGIISISGSGNTGSAGGGAGSSTGGGGRGVKKARASHSLRVPLSGKLARLTGSATKASILPTQ
jgi:hypothetical protein